MCGKQGVVLKDRVDRTPIGRHAFDRFAEDLDVAGGRLIEARDQAKARRLARARRPEHGEELAGDDVEVDAVDGLHRAEMAATPRNRTAVEADGRRADGMACRR